MIVALAGGTGAAKLLRGLARATDEARLVVVGNTGDDLTWWGLAVSPDLDSVTYALGGLLDPDRGWGHRDETFRCQAAMARLGAETWFQLGDQDLALHLRRTELLRTGATLSAVTATLGRALGVRAAILPMSDDPVQTRLRTPAGWLTLEEFFVRERTAPAVLEVAYEGAAGARPAPGVREAIGAAEAVVVCCSNPVTSIGPILAVPGVAEALTATPAPVVAVSPIVGGAAVSGPAGKLMAARGLPVSADGVAAAYQPWLDVLLIDRRDAALAPAIEHRGARPVLADLVMADARGETALAESVLAAVGLVG
ncbi:MAG TPA: 2-phospho-L-lactate transferase [Methylomirabilota bacterium]|nr:2-phospho-L-lactate transferase [Methylomirabilota bacterium]